MKKSIIPILGALLLAGRAAAQDDIPLLRPEERQAVDAQTDEFNQSLAPALTNAARSTVRVWAGKRRLAYGTVVGDGHKVLTKWSEIARANGSLRVESAAGEVLNAKVSGVYQGDDLAVLETTGTALVPVKWSQERPRLGAFLAAPQPDGRPAAFGVVSVLERNLRQTDRAYLGVGGDRSFDGPGVRIGEIYPQSGAEAAGLKPGDIILKVGERPISGVLELQNSLIGINPGSTIALQVRDGGVEKKIDVLLGNRPNLYNPLGGRLRQMERMGGEISRVRDSFPSALQTDMRVRTDQVGGPVVDLQGRVLGITLARADRTRSFIMPAAAVEELLKKDPQDPAQALVRNDDENPELPVRRPVPRIVPPPGNMRPGNPERMRQHLSEMQRLMDFMREEMQDLERQER
jgi:S1-C subfamily serine protease